MRCLQRIDSITAAALLCVPHFIITHKMVNVFWAPVVKRSSRSSWWGGQEASLKTMVKQLWWEPWPQGPAEGGIRPWGMALPGGGIIYNIIAPICRQGTEDQRWWPSYSRSHCLVVVLTIFHVHLLKCEALCTIHYTTLCLSQCCHLFSLTITTLYIPLALSPCLLYK